MFRNYIKVGLRYLLKHKGYTLINVLGLSVGIAAAILIMLFVRSEHSFDRFHAKADRIHRAWLQEFYEGQIFTNVVTPIPLAPLLQENLEEVEAAGRVANIGAPIQHQVNIFNFGLTCSISSEGSTNPFQFMGKDLFSTSSGMWYFRGLKGEYHFYN